MVTRVERFETLMESLPGVAREGLLIHLSRLPVSERCLLLPRQLAYYYDHAPLVMGESEPVRPAGFVCGVSGRNELPAVNYCQDQRAWRASLQRRGIKVVTGASFSGRSHSDHLRYARRIGFPVSLKPVIRNTLHEEIVRDIRSRAELDFLFRRIREVRKNKASDLAASPYAMTRLSEDHIDEHGDQHLPLSVRYVVERQMQGIRLRLLVADGKVVAALYRSDDKAAWKVCESLHESYLALGQKIASAMQGMAFLRVDLVVDDPAVEASHENQCVIELSEHLECHQLYHDVPEVAQRLLRQVAEIESPVDHDVSLALRVVLSGISRGERLEQELTTTAERLGLSLKLERLDPVTGRVMFEIEGALWACCALTWIYANGLGIQEVPTSVDCRINEVGKDHD
jgi:hypothetical protein